jgi:hypothetical protein
MAGTALSVDFHGMPYLWARSFRWSSEAITENTCPKVAWGIGRGSPVSIISGVEDGLDE